MKTTDNFNKFNSIVNDYNNGNISDYIKELNALSKANIIRFTLFLKFQCYGYEVYADGNNQLKLREIHN